MHSTYYGVNIWHAGRNTSGIRYNATVSCRNLRADTLEGIRRLIRMELKK